MLGRLIAQLVNEACFALGEGLGTAEDVDLGMVLGLNHPRPVMRPWLPEATLRAASIDGRQRGSPQDCA